MKVLKISKGVIKGMLEGDTFLKGIRVLNYHGVVDESRKNHLTRNFHTASQFQEQINFLKRQNILSLDQLHDHLQNNKRAIPRGTLITFDDGYTNNIRAAEMLKRAGLPSALFVTTNAVAHGELIWTVELSLLMLYGKANSIDLLSYNWNLSNPVDRMDSFRKIRGRLKILPAAERKMAFETLKAQFPDEESERLIGIFPEFRFLTESELSELSANGVTIGGHGVNHEIQHPHQTIKVIESELIDSKNYLEKLLNKPCHYFAYPNGNCTPVSEQQAAAAGYRMCFTTYHNTISSSEVNYYSLPRIEAGGSLQNFVRKFYWLPKKTKTKII